MSVFLVGGGGGGWSFRFRSNRKSREMGRIYAMFGSLVAEFMILVLCFRAHEIRDKAGDANSKERSPIKVYQ